MNAEELIKKIRTIDIQTKGWVDAVFQGAYHTRFKGQGIQFNDVREYTPGDDTRRIDWRVTAKLNRPYIKEFDEDRNLTVILAVDASQSQYYQSGETAKLDRALEVAAILGFSAVANGDNVGLALFTDHVESFIPPKSGKHHMFRLLSHMINHPPSSKKTNITDLCQTLMTVLKRRSVVIIISDFICDNYASEFRHLAQKHDTIPVVIHDPVEHAIPSLGWVLLEDPEDGRRLVCNTSSTEGQETLSGVLHHQTLRRNHVFSSVGVRAITVSTDGDIILPLKQYFQSR